MHMYRTVFEDPVWDTEYHTKPAGALSIASLHTSDGL